MEAKEDLQEDVESDHDALDIFADPKGYYPPSPKPTTERHTMLSGQVLTLRLVGHNPLWGHHLWQAGRIISTYLEKNPSLVISKTVLELGAGAGLPSLVCAVLGAKKVVVTDYPDPDLISNLQHNIDALMPRLNTSYAYDINAEGLVWGGDTSAVLHHVLPRQTITSDLLRPCFDILILADLLFNHSEHTKLVSTIDETLTKTADAKALVFFTPYRPWLYEKDMAFFDLVREAGMTVEKILEEKMEKVMFDKDPGDEELRRTVFGYEVKWAESVTSYQKV